jgi:hypothetical protein
MIEAIACRTLVIAYCHRSIPQLIENGITGFIIDGLEAARRAADHIPTITQTHRRRLFEPYVNVSCMAENYLTVYQRPIKSKLAHIYAE